MAVGYRVRVTDGRDRLSRPCALAQTTAAILRGLGLVCDWPQLYTKLMDVRPSQKYIYAEPNVLTMSWAVFDEEPYNITRLALMLRSLAFLRGSSDTAALIKT